MEPGACGLRLGEKRELWWNYDPAAQSKECVSETLRLTLRAPHLYPKEALSNTIYVSSTLRPMRCVPIYPSLFLRPFSKDNSDGGGKIIELGSRWMVFKVEYKPGLK